MDEHQYLLFYEWRIIIDGVCRASGQGTTEIHRDKPIHNIKEWNKVISGLELMREAKERIREGGDPRVKIVATGIIKFPL